MVTDGNTSVCHHISSLSLTRLLNMRARVLPSLFIRHPAKFMILFFSCWDINNIKAKTSVRLRTYENKLNLCRNLFYFSLELWKSRRENLFARRNALAFGLWQVWPEKRWRQKSVIKLRCEASYFLRKEFINWRCWNYLMIVLLSKTTLIVEHRGSFLL